VPSKLGSHWSIDRARVTPDHVIKHKAVRQPLMRPPAEIRQLPYRSDRPRWAPIEIFKWTVLPKFVARRIIGNRRSCVDRRTVRHQSLPWNVSPCGKLLCTIQPLMRRSRAVYVGLVAGTVLLGLSSRRFRSELPVVVADYAGDTFWAAMVYFIIATIWNKTSPGRLALGALVFSFVVEFSQVYQAAWINALRATRFGGLVLGHGFLWSDLVCYAVGVALAVGVDRMVRRRFGQVSVRTKCHVK
jgi:hypothetical protein